MSPKEYSDKKVIDKIGKNTKEQSIFYKADCK
jgi:hypothetical protein